MLPARQEMNLPLWRNVLAALEMNPQPQEMHLQLWEIRLPKPEYRPLAQENGLPVLESIRATSAGSTLPLKMPPTRYSTLTSH